MEVAKDAGPNWPIAVDYIVMRPQLLIICLSLGICCLPAAELHVGTGKPHATITGAITAASAGDTIIVHGGRYSEGNIRVDKPLTLSGLSRPIIDGGLKTEILTITASEVAVRGFSIQNGGRTSTSDLAGVRVENATRVTIEDNQLRNCNFAVYLARARDCTIRGNVIQGEPGQELNSGNGIHIWSCQRVRVAGNTVSRHRDGIYLEFASESKVEENLVEKNFRYGLHFMNAHESTYSRNRFSRNGAGVAVMYSRHVEMTGNFFDYNWGSSAYGLLLKDITDSRISGNIFHHNSTAIYAQGATRVSFERNQFEENGWALRILASGANNSFQENNFKGNSFDVGTNGQLSDHKFARNYWDRYEGYDLNHDGTGDISFQPVSLFSMLVERVPSSILLLRSFTMHLMDRAEKALPSLTPESVIDQTPAFRPHSLKTTSGKFPGKPVQP